METLQEYRARQAEAFLRRNYQQIRREFWERKAEASREERRDHATRPWASR